MKQYVGLDVSMEETKLHVLDEEGRRVWRGKCRSHPDAIEAALRKHAPHAEKIGIETGPLTTWLWTELTQRGFPMVCLDARHAKRVLDMNVNKTDDNDAEGLAHIVRSGWYREVRVKSREAMLIKSLVGARGQFSLTRTMSPPLSCRCCRRGARSVPRPPCWIVPSWRRRARARLAAC
jgi:transposase